MIRQNFSFLPVRLAFGARLFFLLALPQCAVAEGQTLRDVAFTQYGDYSSNSELMRRLLSPLTAARLGQDMRRSGKAMAVQPVDLLAERFIVYVPPQRPAGGYALIVFVPPWQGARLPSHWAAVLDRYGVIFVGAARSGNDESALGRREPLALLAAYNVMRQYAVDLERIYVAGFSGGSRIALRLALGYPDLFRGAILNAGSDPIGDQQIALPPKELLFLFQDTSHIIYLTGDRDADHMVDTMASMRSLHKWCVFNVDDLVQPRVAHEIADAAALARALGTLGESTRPDRDKLAACRSRIDADLEDKLRQAQLLSAAGRRVDADKLLVTIDERFGGLAAPRSVELAPK